MHLIVISMCAAICTRKTTWLTKATCSYRQVAFTVGRQKTVNMEGRQELQHSISQELLTLVVTPALPNRANILI